MTSLTTMCFVFFNQHVFSAIPFWGSGCLDQRLRGLDCSATIYLWLTAL